MFSHLSLPQAMAPDPFQKVTEVGNVSVLLNVALGIGTAPQHVFDLQSHMYQGTGSNEEGACYQGWHGKQGRSHQHVPKTGLSSAFLITSLGKMARDLSNSTPHNQVAYIHTQTER